MVFSKDLDDSVILQNLKQTSKKKLILKKSLSLLPHLFTLGNVFFGFCSIIFAAKDELFAAASFILLAALMDAVDGRVARLFGVTSSIGVQLDSLGDAISFCLAPSILFYSWQFKYLGFLGILFSSIFLFCGIIRLAKFNVTAHKQFIYFCGLPTTIAGCFLAVVVLNFFVLEKSFYFLFGVGFLFLFLSLLMISRIKFPTFKKRLFGINKYLYIVFFILSMIVASFMQFRRLLLISFVLYLFSAIWIFFREKN